MSSMIGTKKILDNEYEIHANAHGVWDIREAPQEERNIGRSIGSGDTLDKAVNAARKTIKSEQTPVSIPFNYRGKDGWVRAVATGLHGGTRRVQAEVPGEGRVSLNSYYRAVFGPDVELTTLEHYDDLVIKKDQIDRELRDIEQRHKTLNLSARIQAERERAAAEQN